MSVPEISVVMSVFNGAKSLSATLESVLGQEDCKLEFIVVDDGSRDETGRILGDWAARDPRLHTIRLPRNEGLTKALIRGCAEARGTLIARQDCGDVSLPGRMAAQAQVLLGNNKLSFVSCWTRVCTARGEFLFESRGSGLASDPTEIIDLSTPHGVLDGPTHHGSVMFRRVAYEEVGGYRPHFYYGQDWDLWYRLAERGEFLMLQDVYYEARLAEGDISMMNKEHQSRFGDQSLRALQLRMAGESEEPALIDAARIRSQLHDTRISRQKAGQQFYFLGECLRQNGNKNAAGYYLRKAIGENPLLAKAWLRLLQLLIP